MRQGVCMVATFLLGWGSQSCSTSLLRRPQLKSPVTQASGALQMIKRDSAATIVALDNNTFRFHLSYNQVWDSALDVLLENYNLTIVDHRSGIITTEWDTFYLDHTVYRNKISLRVKKLAYNMTDVTIHNSVETLAAKSAAHPAGVWLPHSKNQQEMGRLIHNMAINMDQPRPVLPQDMIATSTKLGGETTK